MTTLMIRFRRSPAAHERRCPDPIGTGDEEVVGV